MSSAISTYLKPTRSIDSEARNIVTTAARLTRGARDNVARAVRIHDYVRDEVKFGWVPAFDAQTASQTLSARVGFCNTKTPLFVALLRAAGIPARIHVVGIHKRILLGLADPIDKYIDHSYAEVLVDDRWLSVDTHIVDAPLHRAALAKLRATGGKIGFGVHVNGTCEWDGRSDSFGQFVDDGAVPRLTDVDFGVQEDIPAFYRSGRARTSQNLMFRRIVLPALVYFANRRVRALRGSYMVAWPDTQSIAN